MSTPVFNPLMTLTSKQSMNLYFDKDLKVGDPDEYILLLLLFNPLFLRKDDRTLAKKSLGEIES